MISDMKSASLFLFSALFISLAFGARPVARWDVVPWQRVSGVFNAGVVAFHESGVKVEFTLEAGGKSFRFTADNPVFNNRTAVWEFFVPVETDRLPAGPLAIKARAVSGEGESYDLPVLELYNDPSGKAVGSRKAVTVGPSDSLKEAIAAVGDGGTVFLKKGRYSLDALGGKERMYWTTLTPAPGAGRDDVEFFAGRPGCDKLKFKGVTLFCDVEGRYSSIVQGENGQTSCWLDDCRMTNKKGRWAANANVFGNHMKGYVTGGETFDMCNGPGGSIVRGHTVRCITSDAWTGSDRLVVNCRSFDIDPGKTGAHPDFHQSHAVAPNWVHDVILYNVSGYDCKCQGLFGTRLRDSAFVNISFECDAVMHSQYGGVMENVFFAHLTIVDQAWLWRSIVPKDVRCLNSVFTSMWGHDGLAGGDGSRGLKVWNNAFFGKDRRGRSLSEYGLDALRIAGPLPDSLPAAGHGVHLQSVPADINGTPYLKSARPCGAYATSFAGEQLRNLQPPPKGGRFKVPDDRVWPEEVGGASVCLWADDRFAACSITIDDNCRPDHDWWTRLCDELGIKVTWFVVTDHVEKGRNSGFNGTWADWQRLADKGHSVQSHTANHKTYRRKDGTLSVSSEEIEKAYSDSLESINANITNNFACTIAYPCGEAHASLAARHAIACRGVYGVPSAASSIDYMNTNKGSGGRGHVQIVAFGETEEDPKWIRGRKNLKRGWNIALYHYVHAGRSDEERQRNAANVEREVRYIASLKDDRLWVCRFDDAAKYAQERDSSAVSSLSVDGKIILTLTDRMDDKLFDYPLTVKVRLPDDAKSCSASQSGKRVPVRLVAHEGKTYALVNAVPDRGAVILEISPLLFDEIH